MKLALLATLVAFAGSLAGFGLTTGASEPPVTNAAAPPEQVVVGDDHDRRDCPRTGSGPRGSDRA